MRNRNLTFITLWKLNDWGMYNRRDEAILRELSRRNNVKAVLHIEHISFKGLMYKIFEWLKEKNKSMKKVFFYHFIKGLSLKPIAIDSNKKYYIYSVVYAFPNKNPLLTKINNLLMNLQYRAINKHFAKFQGEIVLIAYPPSQYLTLAVKKIRHNLLIADFEDDTAERQVDENKKNQILDNYKEILPLCNWIFSTSPSINQKYRNYTKKEITHLPNGVDIYNFQENSHKKLFKKNNFKIIGYIGVLNKEIDAELLDHILACFPDVNLILIGSATDEMTFEINKLTKRYGNLNYLGVRNYKDIPAYISDFDILINIKKNDYNTAGGESQKIYEYLLTGKPIVSTPVPPADKFKDVIYVASDKYKFVELLQIALEENAPELRKKRIRIAINNSWSQRVDVILDNLSKLI